MALARLIAVVITTGLIAPACESDVHEAPGGIPRGRCDAAEDCASGMNCVEVVPGGFRVCEQEPKYEVPGACEPGEVCCVDEDCPSGRCLRTLENADFCEDFSAPAQNTCFGECTSDGDCADLSGNQREICIPPRLYGALGRSCIEAYCRLDEDCTAEPGGVCAVIEYGCWGRCRPLLGCVYPGAGACTTNDDCGDDHQCHFDREHQRSTCRLSSPCGG